MPLGTKNASDEYGEVEVLNEKIDENNEKINRKIEDNYEKTNKKIEEQMTVVRQEISEVNGRLENANQEVQQVKTDFVTRMTKFEEVSHTQIEAIRTTTAEGLQQVRTDLGEKCRGIDTAVNEVRGQGQHNREKIEEIQNREITKIREELEIINNRPPIISQFQHIDNREAINFKSYKRNPMEFMERVGEQLSKTRENRWPVIRGHLDEYFRDINNWWTATRHDLTSYEEFKAVFKGKYWSEATQNIVRDNICLLYTSRCV